MAGGGVKSPRLAALAKEYWQAHLAARPIDATLLGIPGFDDRMPDESPRGRAHEKETLSSLRERLRATVAPADLNAIDAVTRGLLAEQLDADLAYADCHLEDWAVDPRDGPQVSYQDLAALQPVRTPADRQALVARWRAMSGTIDQITDNLLSGLAAGKVSARSEVERVARQLDELLARPDGDWPLNAPSSRVPAGTWRAAEREQFQTEVARAIGEGIRPAFARLRTAVRDRILPRARGDNAVGISNVPGGAACYTALARVHTSLLIDPAAVHQLGLDELKRIRGEMEALGPAALGTSDFATIQRRLRGEPRDPSMFFSSREQIEATAKQALQRASAAMPRFVHRLPRTPCAVKRIESHVEKDAPVAYYRPPAVDGSRAGGYYVNTYDPASRPRFESEALAFHEAVPGHHVQIALAQEMTGVPEFRKHLGVTAFVEGWGLYAEGLADELGLYSAPLTRMGRLSLEAWRAARLVADTGLHALGWSRAQTVDFFLKNTTTAPNNIETEVDRYIGWPAQALAYKLGELEIRKLRTTAHNRMGSAFDLAAFHDVVLGNGAVTFSVLRDQVDHWSKAAVNRTEAVPLR